MVALKHLHHMSMCIIISFIRIIRTMMHVIISCVFLFELLGFMLAFVCAHVSSMKMHVKCPLKQLSYT